MIDWNRVAELKAEVGEDGFREVVDLFMEEMSEIVDRISTGTDPAQIENELHFIKGSALTLGLFQLGTLCESGEGQAAEGQADAIDLPAILTCFRNSRAALVAGPAAVQMRNSASASSSVMSR